MAVINNLTPEYRTNAQVVTITWPALSTGDTGSPVDFANFLSKTFQVSGTFGGATVVIEGSNDGVTWSTVNTLSGSPLSFTTSSIRRTDDVPLYVRPRVSGGAGVAVDVLMTAINGWVGAGR